MRFGAVLGLGGVFALWWGLDGLKGVFMALHGVVSQMGVYGSP